VGADRFATSTLVANRFFPTPLVVGFASGENFPDAMVASAILGRWGEPLLLTPLVDYCFRPDRVACQNDPVGALSVISVGFLIFLFAMSMLLWFGLVPLRRRVGRWAFVVGTVGAVLLTATSAADAVNAHFQYLPRLSDVLGQRDWPTLSSKLLPNPPRPPLLTAALAAPTPAVALHPRGAVVTITIGDQGVGFPGGKALVYLPPQYFTSTTSRFPVVYLLHGSPGMPVDWLRGGNAAAAGLTAAAHGRPQILVMPHLSRNWLDDSECVNGAHMQVETYVVDDLVPAVDAQLRTRRDRNDRAIGGMSAGGYCALNLGLRHRDLFGSIVDMSGYTHPTHAGGMTALFGARRDLAKVAAANSPDSYAAQLPANPPTRLYFICGRADHGPEAQMSALRITLENRGLPVSWVLLPGGHTYGVWRPGLVDGLDWTSPAPAASASAAR
jgi:enterochelin esterase-like enzyme